MADRRTTVEARSSKELADVVQLAAHRTIPCVRSRESIFDAVRINLIHFIADDCHPRRVFFHGYSWFGDAISDIGRGFTAIVKDQIWEISDNGQIHQIELEQPRAFVN